MELFREVNIDWLSKKWILLGFSLVFSVAGLLSILFWHHIPVGVDFKGGTQVHVSFGQKPNEDHIRAAFDDTGIKDAKIQAVKGDANARPVVLISLPEAGDNTSFDARAAVLNALNAHYRDGDFKVESSQTIGPTAGKQLRKQATLAVLY